MSSTPELLSQFQPNCKINTQTSTRRMKYNTSRLKFPDIRKKGGVSLRGIG